MQDQALSNADRKLLDLVWAAQPVSSPELCRRAEQALGWKRTTTYTVLKRLIGKGYLKNEDATVLSRSFGGSLPSFLAAFLRSGSVSDQEAAELERMIADYRQGH